MGDVGLRLTFEKAFVAALTEIRGRIHHKFGIGGKRNGAVAGQIKPMQRFPVCVGIIGSDFKMNQILSTLVVFGHRRKRFPIDAFLINAQAAPLRFVLKNLMSELVDAGTGLAGASVTGDEPATAELISFPSQPTQFCNVRLAWTPSQHQPDSDNTKQNSMLIRFVDKITFYPLISEIAE